MLAGLSVGHVVGDYCTDRGVEPVYPKLGVDLRLVTEPWLDARIDNSSQLTGVNQLTGRDRSITDGSRLAGVTRLIA